MRNTQEEAKKYLPLMQAIADGHEVTAVNKLTDYCINFKGELSKYEIDGIPFPEWLEEKNKPYQQKQEKWVKKNGIKEGSRLKVTRDWEKGEFFEDAPGMGGVNWCCRESQILFVSQTYLGLNCHCAKCGKYWLYPYNVLEPVKEEYEPLTPEDLPNEPFWVATKNGNGVYTHSDVVVRISEKSIKIPVIFGNSIYCFKELFFDKLYNSGKWYYSTDRKTWHRFRKVKES